MEKEQNQAVAESSFETEEAANNHFPNADQTDEDVILHPGKGVHHQLVNRTVASYFQGAVPEKMIPIA